jgi:hypothetical protein
MKNVPQVSTLDGALVLIDMLYHSKVINKPTYEKIIEKYGHKTIEKQANIVYNMDNKIG